jgi:hypothetical protein
MWLSLLTAVFACSEPTPVEGLVDALAAAEAAYAELSDDAPFLLDRVSVVLPCVAEPLTPPLAARVHRLQGLRLWAVDRTLAVGALRAARELDPQARFSEAMLSPDHSARAVHEGWSGRSATERVPAPRTGALWFDGQPGRARPTERPTLFQHGGATSWVPPEDPLPTYEVRGKPVVPVAVAAGVAGLAAAGSYGAAWGARGQATQAAAAGDRAAADAAVVRTNTMTAVAATSGATALVLGGLAAWWGAR